MNFGKTKIKDVVIDNFLENSIDGCTPLLSVTSKFDLESLFSNSTFSKVV